MKIFHIVCVSFIAALLLPRVVVADAVDEYLKSQMQAHHIAGVAVNVIRDGKSIKAAGYGVANVELNVPVTPETVFEIGSLTKQFTAAGILMLEQENALKVGRGCFAV